MTSALPYFMLPLSKIMTALNQNLVKVETSKALTPLERQLLARLHRAMFQNEETFYNKWVQSSRYALGCFCSGGTLANLTALWVARNRLLGPTLRQSGFPAAMIEKGWKKIVILVSERAHYSFAKTADILGLGQESLIKIPVNEDQTIRLDLLRLKLQSLQRQAEIGILALIGIAGTTETGIIDPLDEMAVIAKQNGIHFHVDAAWGGAVQFSKTHRNKLKGIEKADSITIDAHKQMYVPMGAGMVLFKQPEILGNIEHHAQYVIRKGSRDLGRYALEGSRSGMVILVDAVLRILGYSGFELLISQGIDKAQTFAKIIKQHQDFELISEPTLNIITYRYFPGSNHQEKVSEKQNQFLNKLTAKIQKKQRENGRSFVSRTTLQRTKHGDQEIVVFRVVLANPCTTIEILQSILEEQRIIAAKILKVSDTTEFRSIPQAGTDLSI